MQYKYKQKFHAVGQGLFYSSSLSQDNNQANIVFDCGSKSLTDIHREVNAYIEEGVTEIDLLIISHLHYDHVSGLDELLKDTAVITVKTIILPYLNKYERILLQIANDSKSTWYSSFLANPYKWLSEKENINNIIVINGSGEKSSSNDENILNNLNSSENFSIQNHLTKADSNITTPIRRDENIQSATNVSFYQDKGYIQIASLYFKFFNYQIDSMKLDAFKTEITALGIIDTASVLDILKDKDKRRELKEAYKKIDSNLNKTSLVAYQGLILQRNKDNIVFYGKNSLLDNYLFNFLCSDDCDCFIDGHFHGHISKHKYRYDLHCFCKTQNNCKSIIGTLLLGDIEFDDRKNEFFNYFGNLLKTIKLVQLSHHGAMNGWDDKLCNNIPQSCLYIASHKSDNSKHPDREVLVKLAQEHRKYISVTEKKHYCFECEFEYR